MKFLCLILLVTTLSSCNDCETVEEYYPNGVVEKSYCIVNGRINGRYKEFYSNGNIRLDVDYSEGLRNGESNTYYENGQLETKYHYINDKANGIYEKLSEKGESIETGEFKDDQAIGWFSYFENGALIGKKQFIKIKKRTLLNQYIVFDTNGDTIKGRSNYFDVNRLDENQYSLSLSAPMFSRNKMTLIKGYFDDYFNPTGNIDTLIVNSLDTTLYLNKGEKVILCDMNSGTNEKNKLRFLYFDP